MHINNKLIRSNGHRAFSLKHYLLLMCTLLFCLLQNTAYAQNKLVEGLSLNESQEKNFFLTYDKEYQQLQVNGSMEIGILPAFKKMLAKHPESTTVAFNSNGGNVYQARGLATVIVSNGLDTYVSEDCYSACTIAYVAGKNRTISPQAKLGFHQYNMKSKILNQRFDLEKEQAKDLAYFKSRISNKIFIKKIFSSKNSDIWIPEHQELLTSGVIHKITLAPDR